MVSAIVCELVMTFMFLIVILASTDARAPKAFAPLAIGLALTLIHLISIPVTQTSRSTRRRQHRPGDLLRGGMGARPALVVLGGADRGAAIAGRGLSLAGRLGAERLIPAVAAPAKGPRSRHAAPRRRDDEQPDLAGRWRPAGWTSWIGTDGGSCPRRIRTRRPASSIAAAW